MNVGVYFDLRNPPGWAQDPARLHAATLEAIEEAEHLGLHSVWLTEHHGFEDGYLTQPLTFAAAVAARTSRVRIGTAVLLAPLRHPAHIAEEAALVDLLSEGRLELGLGAGYSAPEFELFGADPATRFDATDRRARDLRALWSAGGVTPRPVQDRIPVWMGYRGPRGARRAGLLGEGLLSADPALVDAYRSGLVEGGHGASSARMAGLLPGFVTDDPERDWPVVARHLSYQQDTYRRAMVAGTGRGAPRPIDPERFRFPREGEDLPRFALGTAEQVAEHVRRATAGAPVDTVFLWGSIAGMPEETVLAHVRAIADELAPLLAGL